MGGAIDERLDPGELLPVGPRASKRLRPRLSTGGDGDRLGQIPQEAVAFDGMAASDQVLLVRRGLQGETGSVLLEDRMADGSEA